MSEWISVKERNPKRGETVECWSKSEGPIHAVFYGHIGFEELIVSKDSSVVIKIKHDDITHWMPLPEPPGEGE